MATTRSPIQDAPRAIVSPYSCRLALAHQLNISPIRVICLLKAHCSDIIFRVHSYGCDDVEGAMFYVHPHMRYLALLSVAPGPMPDSYALRVIAFWSI